MTALDVIALSPLLAAAAYAVWVFARAAWRASQRARRRRRRASRIVTGDALVRAIRASYDDLPYRTPSAPDPLLGRFPCQHHSAAGPRRGQSCR